MGTWVLADLDNIICDFMDQLRTATEQGWHRNEAGPLPGDPGGVESALRWRRRRLSAAEQERRGLRAIGYGSGRCRGRTAWLSLALRSSLRPLFCLVPFRSQ